MWRILGLFMLFLGPFCEAGAQGDTRRLCRTGRPSVEQVASCEATLRADSADTDAAFALASSLTLLRRHADAVGVWRHAARLSPHEYAAHYNLGLVLEILGRHQEALPAFTAAWTRAVDNTERQTSAWHLGVAYYHLDSLELGLRWFQTAARLGSADASSWSYAAVVLAKLGRHAEAVAYWERARLVDPSYLLGREREGELRLFKQSKEIAGLQPPADTALLHAAKP